MDSNCLRTKLPNSVIPTPNCLIGDFTVCISQRYLTTKSSPSSHLSFTPQIIFPEPLFVMTVTVRVFTQLLISKTQKLSFRVSFFPNFPHLTGRKQLHSAIHLNSWAEPETGILLFKSSTSPLAPKSPVVLLKHVPHQVPYQIYNISGVHFQEAPHLIFLCLKVWKPLLWGHFNIIHQWGMLVETVPSSAQTKKPQDTDQTQMNHWCFI